MLLTTIFLLLLIPSLSGIAEAVNSKVLQGRGLSSCPSAVLVNSTTINVDGNEIQRATFSCPEGESFARTNGRERNSPSTPFGHLRRNAAECRTPAPECQCGLQCTWRFRVREFIDILNVRILSWMLLPRIYVKSPRRGRLPYTYQLSTNYKSIRWAHIQHPNPGL